MKKLTLALVVLLVTSPAWAMKVFIDHDKDADLSSYRTFEYQASKDNASKDPLTDGRIVEALKGMFVDAGLAETSADPDLVATYHVKTEEQKSFTTTGMGYGMGPGWGRWGGGVGMGTATTREEDWTDGTLSVDLWTPGNKKLVWRGTATLELKAKPQKLSTQIDQAFTAMLEKWRKMNSGN